MCKRLYNRIIRKIKTNYFDWLILMFVRKDVLILILLISAEISARGNITPKIYNQSSLSVDT